MSEVITEINDYLKENQFDLALNKLNTAIKSKPENIELLLIRGDLFYNLQHYSKALNDYNKILRIESENKIVSSKIEMIKDILKFQAVDIYASTNLNVDPWLD